MSENNSSIDLFGNESSDMIMPTDTEVSGDLAGLVSADISSSLLGERVRKVIMSEENGIKLPNYVIDISELIDKKTLDFKMQALSSVCSGEDGDATIYIFTGKTMTRVGSGYISVLETTLPILSDCFGSGVRIYRNLKEDSNGLDEVKGRDITKMKLNI